MTSPIASRPTRRRRPSSSSSRTRGGLTEVTPIVPAGAPTAPQIVVHRFDERPQQSGTTES
jgi:hypothetical protein